MSDGLEGASRTSRAVRRLERILRVVHQVKIILWCRSPLLALLGN